MARQRANRTRLVSRGLLLGLLTVTALTAALGVSARAAEAGDSRTGWSSATDGGWARHLAFADAGWSGGDWVSGWFSGRGDSDRDRGDDSDRGNSWSGPGLGWGGGSDHDWSDPGTWFWPWWDHEGEAPASPTPETPSPESPTPESPAAPTPTDEATEAPAPVPTTSSAPAPIPTTTPAPLPTITVTSAPVPSSPAPVPTLTVTPPPAPGPSTSASPSASPSATPTPGPAPTPTAAPPAPTAPPTPTTTPTPTQTAVPPTTPTTPGTGPAGPSGVAMPRGDLPGWTQVFSDDFVGNQLSSDWGRYSGQPGGDPAGWWLQSHVQLDNGLLELQGYKDQGKDASGGLAAWGATQLTYGKYEVRFRADVGHGYGYVFLLWPAAENWPVGGEIDFAEDGGDDRQSMAATLHYGAENSQIGRQLKADFTQWHTIGVEWTKGSLVYTLDGKPWASVTGSMVPSTPMFLAMQQQALPCTQWSRCVDSTTPARTDIDIDWVSVYSPS